MTIEASVGHASVGNGLNLECLFFLFEHQVIFSHLLVLRCFERVFRDPIHKIGSKQCKSLLLDTSIRYR